ncbi:MAG: hypothetical protein QF412_10500 [Planctomycetota bacterium]|nr:hypothetical protein [Planctomycetota bacterium]
MGWGDPVGAGMKAIRPWFPAISEKVEFRGNSVPAEEAHGEGGSSFDLSRQPGGDSKEMEDHVEHRSTRGVSLVGATIAVSVISLLAGLVAPAVIGEERDPKLVRILDLTSRVEQAVRRHHADTGSWATEYGTADHLRPRYHELSRQSETPGWSGPYLEGSISQADNPFAGEIYVAESLDWGTGGYRLKGPDGPHSRGVGQQIIFDGVPCQIAEAVDAELDKDIPGDWTRYGRVLWSQSSGGRLCIFLMQP